MDPIHGLYTLNENYIMRTCIAEGKEVTDGLKYGAKKVTTGRKVKPVKQTLEQRVECAIRISLLVYNEPSFVKWAKRWLSGRDRRCGNIYNVLRNATHATYYNATPDAAYAADDAIVAGVDVKEITKIIKMVVEK